MDHEKLKRLRPLFDTPFWSAFEEALKTDLELAIQNMEKANDVRDIHRAQGRLGYIRQLLMLKDEARKRD